MIKQTKEKVTHKVTESVQTTSRVVKNAEQLVQAVALITIAIFSYTQLHTLTNEYLKYFVIGSLAVIALRGSWEFLAFLNKANK